MELKNHKICAIIPAYNEQESIRAVIEDIRKHHPEIKIVVINDSSADKTAAIVRDLGETVLNLPINLGIGGAVQTGMKYARSGQFDFAIQFDGDGQHLACEIEKILSPVIRDEADVVIGSRFLGAGQYKSGFLRRIGIGIFRMVNSVMIGSKITDNTSGFRAYNRQAIAFLAEYYPQDYPEPEAVIELYRNRFRISEVPVEMHERTGGDSSIRLSRSLYYMVKCFMANMIAFSRKPISKEKI
jgi:glycosyltransferase involved in cell wall biosynthesis